MANARVVQINAQLQWVFTQDVPSGHWVAVCDPLGITVEGRTHTEMRENIGEAINLVLGNMVATGDFEQFLSERGWRAINMPRPEQLRGRRVHFDVPIELIQQANKNNGSAKRIH